MEDINNEEVLQYLQDGGLIDLTAIKRQIEEMKNKEYLSLHKNKFWRDNSKYHYWCTYLVNEVTDEFDEVIRVDRKLIKKRTKEEVEKEIINYYKSLEENPTVKQVFNRWVNQKLDYNEIQPQTYDKYRNTFKRFIYPHRICNRKIRNITDLELEDFVKTTIRDFNLTSKGWGELRTIVNGTWKYAKRHGFTEMSITQFMGDMQLSRNAFRKRIFTDEESVFTDEEFEKIVKFIYKDGKPKIMDLGILLAFQTGLRVGEISALEYSDLKDGILKVYKTEVKQKNERDVWEFSVRETTKGRDGCRRVIMTSHACETMKQAKMLNPFGKYLFSYPDGKRILSKQYTRRLYRICDSVGIQKRSMHKARKTYASKLIDAGVSERLIMNQLGHTEIETTRKYYYFFNGNAEEARREINRAIGDF